jgi:alcohol dehydrogenase
VVDATGSPDGFRDAIQLVRPRGTVFLKSTVHGSTKTDMAPVIVNEITLVGSRCGRFEPAIALLESRSVNVADMISDSLPLNQANRAFAQATKPGVLKVLLQGD